MAALVSALDTHTPLQRGENGHVEHGWSNDGQERTLQLSFQLTRTKDAATLASLGENYRSLVVSSIFSGAVDEESGQAMTEILYKMMLHTRDLVAGKGEYALFYELLSRWAGIGHFCSDGEKKRCDFNYGILIKFSSIFYHLLLDYIPR